MALSTGPDERHGFLRNCLVEGDSDQERRVHRNKRRAIIFSIVLQILVVAALVLFPLLSKGENIAGRVIMFPPVPYGRGGTPNQERNFRRSPHSGHSVCRFCPPQSVPNHIESHVAAGNVDLNDPSEPIGPGIPGVPTGIDGGLTPLGARREQVAPEVPLKPPASRQRVSESVQQAMLYHRVEPVYPALAIQIRHEGRVELHAFISTDGSIELLEVLSGDPLLIPSALAAVRQWRYHPTLLNGQPVEVDTHITVIYTLNH